MQQLIGAHRGCGASTHTLYEALTATSAALEARDAKRATVLADVEFVALVQSMPQSQLGGNSDLPLTIKTH